MNLTLIFVFKKKKKITKKDKEFLQRLLEVDLLVKRNKKHFLSASFKFDVFIKKKKKIIQSNRISGGGIFSLYYNMV